MIRSLVLGCKECERSIATINSSCSDISKLRIHTDNGVGVGVLMVDKRYCIWCEEEEDEGANDSE